jgi:hypothetical protein
VDAGAWAGDRSSGVVPGSELFRSAVGLELAPDEASAGPPPVCEAVALAGWESEAAALDGVCDGAAEGRGAAGVVAGAGGVTNAATVGSGRIAAGAEAAGGGGGVCADAETWARS